jgi:hypothetical protein
MKRWFVEIPQYDQKDVIFTGKDASDLYANGMDV